MRARQFYLTLVLATQLACSGDTASEPTTATPGTGNGSDTGSKKAETPRDTDVTDTETPPAAPITCVGEPGSLYALTVTKLTSTDPLPLCAYKGAVVLIVNGASSCGYTPQYEPLEDLYAKYKETQGKSFAVLAFPSNSFNQESGTEETVSEFCTTKYHITFPLTAIAPVIDDTKKGDTAQPVYKWLYAQPGMSAPVAWNFEKFLIGKDGKIVKRWLSAVAPDTKGGEIDLAIAAELAK